LLDALAAYFAYVASLFWLSGPDFFGRNALLFIDNFITFYFAVVVVLDLATLTAVLVSAARLGTDPQSFYAGGLMRRCNPWRGEGRAGASGTQCANGPTSNDQSAAFLFQNATLGEGRQIIPRDRELGLDRCHAVATLMCVQGLRCPVLPRVRWCRSLLAWHELKRRSSLCLCLLLD